jgi:hypothetical protein
VPVRPEPAAYSFTKPEVNAYALNFVVPEMSSRVNVLGRVGTPVAEVSFVKLSACRRREHTKPWTCHSQPQQPCTVICSLSNHALPQWYAPNLELDQSTSPGTNKAGWQ